MSRTKHHLRAYQLRKISHPVLPNVEKHWITVRALDFPDNISTAANAREPVGLNKRVYRDVRASLEAQEATPGTFDLMNKGITILAESVRMIDSEQKLVEITVDDESGGIVDGAHTAKIISETNRDGATNADQYVEVYIRTGVPQEVWPDIARGLNTGMQVAAKSIYNIDKNFQWLKEAIADKPYANMFAWKESDDCDYDVRDLVGLLEVFNVFDFPNDSGKHPISAYEKWSIPLEHFHDDYEENRDNLANSKYYRLRALLPGILSLYDHIRREFRDVHNQSGGIAGQMKIVEQAGRKKMFEFPFADPPLTPSEYRLTKGATYPIIAAFRNYVELDPISGDALWAGGFKRVLSEWRALAPLLVGVTHTATKEVARNPDAIGKNRLHWDQLHNKVQIRILRAGQRAAFKA